MDFKPRSILDAAREAKARGVKTEPPKVEQPPVVQKQEPKTELKPAAKKPFAKPPPPPFAKTIKIKASCGHEIEFGLWDDKKDKFREQRKKKNEGMPCKECRQAAHLKREAEQKAIADANPKKKKKNKGPSNAQRKIERLPTGSVFHATYIEDKKWTGTLTVPIEGREPEVFTAFDSAVFKLMSYLDHKYRKFLEPTPNETIVEKPIEKQDGEQA